MAYIFGSIWDRRNRNALNELSKNVDVHGKSIQDLVAEGQLSPTQYTELLQTINGLIARGEVTFDDIDINQGKMLPKHLSEEVLSMITGDAPVNATPADGAVTEEKIAEKAITPNKTNFIKAPNNLINKKNLVQNKALDGGTGKLIDGSQTNVTDFLKVEPGETYVKANIPHYYLYDENKEYISRYSASEYTVTSSVSYLRFSIIKSNIDIAQLNKGTNLLPYDEHIYRLGDATDMPISSSFIEDGTVDVSKTTFITPPNNLINKKNLVQNKAIDRESGELINEPQTYVTDFLKVEPGESYVKANILRYFLYDENKEFIDYYSASGYTVSDSVSYVRFEIQKSNIDIAQLNKGTNLLPYDEHIYRLGDTTDMPITTFIEDGSVDESKTTFIKHSSNLFNDKTVLLNKTVERPSGNLAYFAGNFISDFIPVDINEEYTKHNAERWLYYTPDKSYLGNSIADTVTIPSTAGFVRLSGYITNVSKTQMNKGSKVLPYESYGLKIDKDLVPDNSNKGPLGWMNDSQYIIEGTRYGYIDVPPLENKSEGSDKPLHYYKTQEFYDEYDALMAKHPDYITRTYLGDDASGTLPIYRYDFKRKTPERAGDFSGAKQPKAIIISGTHPEKAGAWALFKSLQQIAERWHEDSLLEMLRWNMHFIVIPVWSPWSMDNNERWNANLVNVSRNFPEMFEVHEEGHARYGGTEPLSEPEAQYLHDVMIENNDALFFIDFHNFFTTDRFLWTFTPSLSMGKLGEEHIVRMSHRWRTKYTDIENFEDYYVGRSTARGVVDGYSMAFAESIGIRGLVYEVSQWVPWEEGHPRHSSLVHTLGTEAFLNFLVSITNYTVDEKNNLMK